MEIKRNIAKENEFLRRELEEALQQKIMFMSLYDDAMIEIDELKKSKEEGLVK